MEGQRKRRRLKLGSKVVCWNIPNYPAVTVGTLARYDGDAFVLTTGDYFLYAVKLSNFDFFTMSRIR